MAERANEFMNKWGMALIQAVFLAVLIPWGWKMTDAVNTHAVQLQENQTWHSTHLTIIEKDKAILKQEIIGEMEKMIRSLVDAQNDKLDRLSTDVRDSSRDVMSTSAQIKVVTDSLNSLTIGFNALKANVTQALIDRDFGRNAETKKGT